MIANDCSLTVESCNVADVHSVSDHRLAYFFGTSVDIQLWAWPVIIIITIRKVYILQISIMEQICSFHWTRKNKRAFSFRRGGASPLTLYRGLCPLNSRYMHEAQKNMPKRKDTYKFYFTLFVLFAYCLFFIVFTLVERIMIVIMMVMMVTTTTVMMILLRPRLWRDVRHTRN